MTPEQLAKPGTEHSQQVAFMCWCQQQDHDTRLKRAFAIPNGGQRNKVTASRLKAEGVKKGVPDVFIPVPVGTYHGLWIEFKKKQGRASKEQLDWLDYLQSQNYSCFVAYSYCQAMDAALDYIKQGNAL